MCLSNMFIFFFWQINVSKNTWIVTYTEAVLSLDVTLGSYIHGFTSFPILHIAYSYFIWVQQYINYIFQHHFLLYLTSTNDNMGKGAKAVIFSCCIYNMFIKLPERCLEYTSRWLRFPIIHQQSKLTSLL